MPVLSFFFHCLWSYLTNKYYSLDLISEFCYKCHTTDYEHNIPWGAYSDQLHRYLEDTLRWKHQIEISIFTQRMLTHFQETDCMNLVPHVVTPQLQTSFFKPKDSFMYPILDYITGNLYANLLRQDFESWHTGSWRITESRWLSIGCQHNKAFFQIGEADAQTWCNRSVCIVPFCHGCSEHWQRLQEPILSHVPNHLTSQTKIKNHEIHVIHEFWEQLLAA